jgi:outer membrane protein TolC
MRHFAIVAVISGCLLLGMGLLLSGPFAADTASPIWAPPALSELIQEGIDGNQEIKSLKERVESLKAGISFAGALDDPRLGFAIVNLPVDSFRFDRTPMTQKQIFIAQKFPWFGKLDLKTQREALTVIRQQAVLEAGRLELARNIADAYYQLGFVATSLQINARLTDIVNQLLGVAETRYATGKGLQQDVLQAQVELSKLLDEKIDLDKRRRTLEDRINGLLNRAVYTPVQPPLDLSYPELQLEVKTLQDQALKSNPRLKIRQADISIADKEIELAHKDYWPDMDVRLAYGLREEDRAGKNFPDLVTGSVTMNIPLWQNSRQDSKLAAVKKSRQAAFSFYRNLLESLPHQVDALVTEIHDTQKNYKLFNDALLVQAEQWASSSLTAYEVGSVNFNTMIGAQVRLLRFELQTSNYIFRIYQKRAELEEILGGPL